MCCVFCKVAVGEHTSSSKFSDVDVESWPSCNMQMCILSCYLSAAVCQRCTLKISATPLLFKISSNVIICCCTFGKFCSNFFFLHIAHDKGDIMDHVYAKLLVALQHEEVELLHQLRDQ